MKSFLISPSHGLQPDLPKCDRSSLHHPVPICPLVGTEHLLHNILHGHCLLCLLFVICFPQLECKLYEGRDLYWVH